MKTLILSLLLAAASPSGIEEGIRRVQAHLLIDDPRSALEEAEALSHRFPNSEEGQKVLIETLSACGMEEKALDEWNLLALKRPDLMNDRHLLEELSWGVLRKAIQSTQQGIRLGALIGSYLTRDIRAVPIFLKMMRDSNAMVRSVAVQMAADFADTPLKEEIERMMQEEKVWMVRLQVIQTAGKLRLKKLASELQALVQSEKTMAEERHMAIQALVHMFDQVTFKEFERLAQSSRAGLRHLACVLATHFQIKEAKGEILRLLSDTHPDVRVAAINAVGLCYKEQMSKSELQEVLKPRLEEKEARVAITAAWAALLIDSPLGKKAMEKWLEDPLAEHRRLAAAALAATGDRATELAMQTLKKSQDPYVRANIAIGLIGQRLQIGPCSDCLYTFLKEEKKMWMWDAGPNPLFQVLAPSHVRYIDQIPNYPESIDQMTRLNLVSILAMIDDPRAIDALKDFLEKKTWGITGVAAATLLQEGDETSLEVVRHLLEDPNPRVRLQASLVLAMYGKDPAALNELQKAYPGAEFELKLHILEALGNIGSSESFGFLVSVLKEPFPMLRVAAASALIQGLNR